MTIPEWVLILTLLILDCHIYGFATIVVQSMWFGNFTCALPAFGLDLFCRKMHEYRATWAHIVPPVALLLAHSEILDKYDLSALKIMMVAAAPLKVCIYHAFCTP